ncbi:MAG: cbb3-type cytochrome c oxidase subunit I [SAR324 cluster bacterium]|nr:cbb3-type cytochrome c oxidase subunit I [SAR324 cluster bacterium]MCH8885739.1 cbb3-type cytochrome c oxidase subunit I [SAR324 cluster bacterium]
MTTIDATPVDAHDSHAGFWGAYIFSRDHKTIGKQFLFASMIFMAVGGLLAMIIRWNLGFPDQPVPLLGSIMGEAMVDDKGVILPEFYNVLFTMHGSIMIFFVVIPMLNGWVANFILPLQIGARDMASPLLNMLSFWFFVVAALVVLSGFLVEGGAAATGWTAYPPLSALAGMGQTLWIVGVAILGLSSIMGSVNYITTVIKLRAPGMLMMRMPIPVWSVFITAFLTLLATPVLTTAMVMLLMDNSLGTSYFLPQIVVSGELMETSGGRPVLFQHIFWFYSHPAVYIMVLPALGVAAEMLAVFSRKPLFGFKTIVYMLLAIAAMSFIVWAHHMYQSGMSPAAAKWFMFWTIAITIPPSVILYNMVVTLLGGSIRFTTPMLHGLGFLSMFLIGGLSGIFLASAFTDIFLHDTYFIVAHLHYVLFGGSLFGIFASIIYWFPKAFGKMMSERLGKVHFWLTFVFFNLTFFPMHFLGAAGHMRRIAYPLNYDHLVSSQLLNTWISVSAFILGASQLIFFYNFIASMRSGKVAVANPWEANTLEWTIHKPGHGNWGPQLPVVLNGPYEYSHPEVEADFLPQTQPLKAEG